MSKNIFVDFDYTITEKHSGGKAMDKDPMPPDNKTFIKDKISEWLTKGHNVIIVTRGIDQQIDEYLTRKLNLPPVMKSFIKGQLSVYAPDIATFRANDGDKFAIIKTQNVDDFLKKSNTEPKNSIFMDDTKLNVTAMGKKFPGMTCIVATRGKYKDTISKIDHWITSSSLSPLPCSGV